jgi:hypothetical protein
LSPRAPRFLLAALLVGAGAGAGAQQPRQFSLERIGPAAGMVPTGDPSAIVAAEIAFAQLARKKGQWTAFKETADKDAVMFVPQVVNAQSWLRKRKDPAQSVSWGPGKVYVACDGSYAVSTGDARWPDGSTSTFITLWRRQERGGYKWALDWGSDKPVSGSDIVEIEGKVAACPPRRPGPETERREEREERDFQRGRRPGLEIVRIPDPPPASHDGQSEDGTLRWSWQSGADGARVLTVNMRTETGFATVVDDHVAATAP